MNGNFQKYTVWSAGSPTGSTKKVVICLYLAAEILLIAVGIIGFNVNFNDDKTTVPTLLQHIGWGITMLFMTGWMHPLLLFGLINETKMLSKNKLITLWFYSLTDFSCIGIIPDDKFILYADDSGVIIADEKDKNESKDFVFCEKNYYVIKKYCEKHDVGGE